MKFKVLAGRHDQYNETYNVGDVVETCMDLCKMFPNKFQRMDPVVPDATKPVGSKPKPIAPVKEPPVEKPPVKEPPVEEEPEELYDTEAYDDVTSNFGKAPEAKGVLVIKDGTGHYYVIDSTDGTLLSEDAVLSTITKTKAFIKRLPDVA